MPSKRHTTDQINATLRRADQELGQGKKVAEVCRILEVNVQTYYRWRQKYGGMKPEMAKQLKALEKENARLKKMVAEQALDMEILKDYFPQFNDPANIDTRFDVPDHLHDRINRDIGPEIHQESMMPLRYRIEPINAFPLQLAA